MSNKEITSNGTRINTYYKFKKLHEQKGNLVQFETELDAVSMHLSNK